jgi:LPXTG-site transpeptidase (sortase) family protein
MTSLLCIMNIDSMWQNINKSGWFYFSGIFSIIFLISFVIFSLSGLAPKSISLYDYLFNKPPEIIGQPFTYDLNGDIPVKYTRPDQIIIDKLKISADIEQPNTFNVAELDSFLIKGAVHYPGSGSVESGNIFIFGHSADLFTGVQNPAYKVFNNLSKLKSGDVIEIVADNRSYFYKVTKVSLVNENEALIRFNSEVRKLTISTCNTFGSREDRWVVEAEMIN